MKMNKIVCCAKIRNLMTLVCGDKIHKLIHSFFTKKFFNEFQYNFIYYKQSAQFKLLDLSIWKGKKECRRRAQNTAKVSCAPLRQKLK